MINMLFDLSIVIIAISTIVVVIGFLRENVPIFPKDWRGRRMIKLAKANGPLLVRNTVAGVTALCTLRDFQAAVRSFKDHAIEGRLSVEGSKLWVKKIEVLVNPTFTFSEEWARVMAHTGDTHWIRVIEEMLVERVTGISYEKVWQEDFDKALSYLIHRKSQLLIPFMLPHISGLDTMGQLEAFGNKCADDAFIALLQPKSSK